jgi:putative ABC transport system substrate-binding protein
MNDRRKLLVALCAGAVATPFGSLAQQQGKVWRVGFLTPRSRPVSYDSDYFGGFLRRMRELGYVEGKSLVIEWRFPDSEYERLPGNITGLLNVSAERSLKFLEMLRNMVPKVSRVTVLVNPVNSAHVMTLESIRAAAQKIKINILPGEARTSQDIGNAFSAVIRQGAGAFIVLADGVFIDQRPQIAELAAKRRLPSIASFRGYVDAGGRMNYGPNFADTYRRAARYVDKILKGAKPADLPVAQPTNLELFINGTTAKALGLKIAQSLLISADTVIE